jgi:hypothetical protein
VPVGGLDARPSSAVRGQEQQIAVLTDGRMSHPHRLDGLWGAACCSSADPPPGAHTEREDAQPKTSPSASYRES